MTSQGPEADFRNPDSRTEGFGAWLRAARESRGLDRREVADALRLSPSMVDALEREDLASLPPPLFIKGYLRSYAAFLGLDETIVVRDFESRVLASDPMRMTPMRKRSTTDLSDVRRGRQLASIILLVLVLGLVMYWWLKPAGAPVSDLALTESESLQNTGIPPDPVPESLAEGQDLSLSEALTDEVVDRPENEPIPREEEPLETSPSPLPIPADASQAQASAAAPGNDVNSVAAVTKLDQASQEQGMATLKIRYQEDCWTEVRDARGRQLIYRLAKAGSEQEVSGEPPFSFYLGYAPGVAVEIDGQAVPLAPLVGDSTVARFKLEHPQ